VLFFLSGVHDIVRVRVFRGEINPSTGTQLLDQGPSRTCNYKVKKKKTTDCPHHLVPAVRQPISIEGSLTFVSLHSLSGKLHEPFQVVPSSLGSGHDKEMRAMLAPIMGQGLIPADFNPSSSLSISSLEFSNTEEEKTPY